MANVGSFTPSSAGGNGFELIAFAPPTRSSSTATTQPTAVPCTFNGPLKNQYIANYPSGGSDSQQTLTAAESACSAAVDCGGVTLRNGNYELRASDFTNASTSGETSYVKRRWLMLILLDKSHILC